MIIKDAGELTPETVATDIDKLKNILATEASTAKAKEIQQKSKDLLKMLKDDSISIHEKNKKLIELMPFVNGLRKFYQNQKRSNAVTIQESKERQTLLETFQVISRFVYKFS